MRPDKSFVASVDWYLHTESDNMQDLCLLFNIVYSFQLYRFFSLTTREKLDTIVTFCCISTFWGLFFLPRIAAICFPPPDLWVSSGGSPAGKMWALTRCCQRDANWKHTRGTCESANSGKWPLICRDKDRWLKYYSDALISLLFSSLKKGIACLAWH